MSAPVTKNIHFVVPKTTEQMYREHFPSVFYSLRDNHHFDIREEVVFKDPATGVVMVVKKDFPSR